jgi:phosphoribosylglycinamide formyltransferase-1
MTRPIRIAIFASGRGSNFQAIHRALIAMPDPPAAIVLCVSNNPHPGAFDYASSAGIATVRSSPKMFSDDREYGMALRELLDAYRIDMIVLAGYMRKIPHDIVEAYAGRILNIHPALLPNFGGEGMYGQNVHRAVVASGCSESGATVHLVDADYDSGPVIAQETVPVLPGDTPESLAERVVAAEHRLYPRVVIDWAEKLLAEPGERLTDRNGP